MNDEHRPVELFRDTSAVVHRQQLGEATTEIQYVSQGHCLIIGDPASALDAGLGLTSNGFTVVQVDPAAPRVDKRLTEDGVAVFTVPALSLSGHLGAWQAVVPPPGRGGDAAERPGVESGPVSGAAPASEGNGHAMDLGVSVYRETGLFDVVLDLSPEPLITASLAPFGYVHATTPDAVRDAVDALSDMKGEFEKPRYFSYNASLCAHSRSELEGCRQCIDVCAAAAITASGEGIQVDPFLCQGCGSCATACPSGAISYAYPRPADALDRTRRKMKEQGATTLILHTEEWQSLIDELPVGDDVLALRVEEVTAFGPDYWLALLAGPASNILLVIDAPAGEPGRRALDDQLQWVTVLLDALGVDDLPVRLVSPSELDDELARPVFPDESARPRLAGLTPQSFATHNDKRQTLRMALDVLCEQRPPVTPITDLPDGAPFGQVRVDTAACTLCMACVSTCPARALQDGQDMPALRFIEANCLQCGLCEKACPESAITLQSRYMWDSSAARATVTLHEEKPFHCQRCHTAFTTQAMIDTMTAKLAGHWMFKDEKALRRLRLCGDCRVRDMFEDDAAGIDIHKP